MGMKAHKVYFIGTKKIMLHKSLFQSMGIDFFLAQKENKIIENTFFMLYSQGVIKMWRE